MKQIRKRNAGDSRKIFGSLKSGYILENISENILIEENLKVSFHEATHAIEKDSHSCVLLNRDLNLYRLYRNIGFYVVLFYLIFHIHVMTNPKG